MAARNPGPYLNQVPLGFPSYNRKVFRDILARRAFMESEVNTRVYKNIFENLGFKGQIRINNKVGVNRIRMRCIQGGYSRGIYKFTRMAKMAFFQTAREGWLKKYGYRPDLFR
ncbi:mitochondrial ribosomal protein S14 precursor, putative [Plasmodium ovale]|uniref:Mitochondrial ribosomal protein S14, putative n=1 Tax=Plasmodium ovale TaxID=36330 RepID=A0A1C3KWE3_PLAOA|nr:mitochondrial ribosomal protein S14 precursor, putative [Plasmodium ovale]